MAVLIRHTTIEDFERVVLLPENVDRLFEYIGGEVIEVVSNNYSSKLAMLIGSYLTLFVIENDLGDVTGADGGFVVAGERYIPDVAFVSRARQPEPSHDAYNPLAPDLAVEVLSPTNEAAKIRIKVVNYLRAGCVVWVVDPETQQAEVYTPDAAPLTLDRTGIFRGADALAGFEIPLSKIFPEGK